MYFLGIFCCFCHKTCVFIIFISFFDEVSDFRNRIFCQAEYACPEPGRVSKNPKKVSPFLCYFERGNIMLVILVISDL